MSKLQNQKDKLDKWINALAVTFCIMLLVLFAFVVWSKKDQTKCNKIENYETL